MPFEMHQTSDLAFGIEYFEKLLCEPTCLLMKSKGIGLETVCFLKAEDEH